MTAAPVKLRPFVIKFGGSLAANANLAGWLAAVREAASAVQPNQFILVPGGGAFADTVRNLQRELHFDDYAAHHMALLAMEQFGLVLGSLWPGLIATTTPAAIRRAWRMHKIPWWAPARMALAAAAPVQSWDMTSDSLSAWLAGELKAERLLLIKSIDPGPETEPHCADLVSNGMIDPLFGHFAATSGAAIFIAGPSALKNAPAIIGRGGTPGVRIRFS